MTESNRKYSPQECLQQAKDLIASVSKDENVALGVSCLAVCGGEIFLQSSSGARIPAEKDSIDEHSIFDLGSLTGSLITTTLILQLVAEGRMKLSDRVSKYLQNFGVLGKASITIGHLLTHTAGLPHQYSFQKDLPDLSSRALVGARTSKGTKEALFNAVNRMSLKAEPGIKHQWSEIGLLTLGLLIESLTGSELDDLAERKILRPLNLKSTSYLNQEKLSKLKLSVDTEKFASSGRCPIRGSDVRAEPFDYVTWAIGGVAGHAGLFSNVVDLAILGNEILAAFTSNSTIIPAQCAEYLCYADGEDRISYNHGWQDLASSAELIKARFSKKAFGRSSALGSAIWIDPELRLVIALAANRKNPTETSRRFEQFRADLASVLVEAVH